MIDFHSHILAGIDEGSRDTEMSLTMLRMEQEQGVEAVVATPHFYAQQDSVKNFLKRRERSMHRLMEVSEREEQIQMPIYLGAEVYYFRGIGEGTLIRELCIQNSRILLLELPFCQWESYIYADIVRLVRDQKLTVILAHVERYHKLQKNREIWNAVMELPVHIQLNTGPFLDWKKRSRSIRIMREQGTVLLGSDTHNLTSRSPNLAQACEIIRSKAGAAYVEKTEKLGHHLLEEILQ